MGRERLRDALSTGKEIVRRLAVEESGMLILTRKVDQGIVIAGNIIVRVLGVERDRVKIGISAPGEVTVLRQELWVDRQDGQSQGKSQKSDQPATKHIEPNNPSAGI